MQRELLRLVEEHRERERERERQRETETETEKIPTGRAAPVPRLSVSRPKAAAVSHPSRLQEVERASADVAPGPRVIVPAGPVGI